MTHPDLSQRIEPRLLERVRKIMERNVEGR